LLNVVGLSVGLSAFGISVLYFEHELTYDTFHPQASNIYRISGKVEGNDWLALLSLPYSNAIHEGQVSGIETAARIRRWSPKYVFVGEEKFFEQNVLFTDPGSAFFDLFNFPLIEGDQSTALSENRSVVLTQKLAQKYFGDKEAIGKIIRFDTIDLTVTGVIKNLPSNTHLVTDLIITHQDQAKSAWGHFVYVKTLPGTGAPELKERILSLNVPTTIHNKAADLRIVPLPSLHFESDLTFDFKPAGNYYYLLLFGSVGLLILLVSSINFITLTFATFSERAKEIAVKKVVGAKTSELHLSFHLETLGNVILCLILSIIVISATQPLLNEFFQIIFKPSLSSVYLLVSLGLLSILIGATSALYPGLSITRIKAVDLFKSKGVTSVHGLTFRQLLLIGQFTILFFVLITLVVVKTQFSYIQNKDLGFAKEGVIKIKRAWGIDSAKYQLLKADLHQLPDVTSVSMGYVPGDEDYGITYRGEDPQRIGNDLLVHSSDFDYLKTLQLKSVAGVTLQEPEDKWPARITVINETLAKQLGYSDPIGQKLILNPGSQNELTRTIDGVIRDFHFRSLHEPIAPHMIVLIKNPRVVNQNILVRTNNASQALIQYLEKKLGEIAPNVPLDIAIMNEDLMKYYKKEAQLSQALDVLIAISFFLSASGLIILCGYLMEIRRKTSAIHKVLGARFSQIIKMFLIPFIRIALVSFVIGATLSYATMQYWLRTFEYKSTLNYFTYPVVFACVVGLVVAVVFVLASKTARLNPSVVLKESD